MLRRTFLRALLGGLTAAAAVITLPGSTDAADGAARRRARRTRRKLRRLRRRARRKVGLGK